MGSDQSRPTPSKPITPSRPVTSNERIKSSERLRQPYHLTMNDLRQAGREDFVTRIYPSLNTDEHLSPNHRTMGQNTRNNVNTTDNFVFVNTTQKRFQPSAPSAPSAPSPPPRVASPAQAPGAFKGNRSQSTSRNQTGLDINCTTCKQQYTDKIFMCARGHSLCNNCKINGRNCRVCGHGSTEVRNIDVENIVGQLKQRCPHADDGCSLSFNKAELEKHVKECPFKEIMCPITENNCNWRGKMPQLRSHFDIVHPSQIIDVDTELCLPNICSETQDVKLVIIGNFHFLFHIKVSQIERKIFMAVQLIGTKISANKWTYEIHVYNKSEPRRKYLYSDLCHSFNEPLFDIFKGKCAMIPLQYAMTFVSDSKFLYKLYIKKEIGNNRRGRNARNKNNEK